MDNTFGSGQKDEQGKDESLQNLEENMDILAENGTDYSELNRESCIGDMVPRHVVTLDEKYLRRCVELIRINAAKAAQCNLSVNLCSKVCFRLSTCSWDRWSSHPSCRTVGHKFKKGQPEYVEYVEEPIVTEIWCVGCQSKLNDVKRSVSYDFMNSPGGYNNYSSHKLGSETPLSENRKLGSKTVHKRPVPMSSSSTKCSDQSSSSSSTTSYQGMLQCTWKGGNPYFIFSLDNQRVVYVANLSKEGSARGRGPDCMYLFHSRKGSHKEHGISDDSNLVGKMKVLNSFSICPQGSKVKETEFVLFSGIKTFNPDMQTSTYNHRKNKGLPKKMVEVFKSSHSSKPSTASRLQPISIMEDSSWIQCQDTVSNSVSLNTMNHLAEELPPNLELAAVYGYSSSSRYSRWPRKGTGGPSSLIDRWRSGGHCDCGGWDLGCPFTVLKGRSSKERGLPSIDTSDASKPFDVFIQGSKHGSPMLRIAHVHDGLYFVHFQSPLSALQSFSIAVAYIHSRSLNFRPKSVKPSR
ncbi:CCT motif family protein isoform 1 [Hibiscus syriacus]|uniref:CCT motif family protein isoform 1 n=1 Tax=Hibiscus syriacus TaxID=106335 RepID=A0A6A3D301_HIBSY|nr:CCT motif family protein isoform 1 [Hibiscus syriacus]